MDDEGWYCAHGNEMLTMLFYPIVVFAEYQAQAPDLGLGLKEVPSEQEIKRFLDNTMNILPRTIPAIYDFWRNQLPLIHKKIGRNALCLCGSGKKFKKCCMLENKTIH